MSLRLRVASRSHVGLVRKNNQDSGYASPSLLVVADGMGGAAAGDLASAVAIDVIRRLDAPAGPPAAPPRLERFADAIAAANSRIADLVAADHHLEGMGTTLTGGVFDGHHLGLAHIGDSRAYLLRDGRLERLTHDDSWVQSLVDSGKLDPADAAFHPHRSLLLKVLNGQPGNDPALGEVEVRSGDRLLFCSDGLCGFVDDERIAELAADSDLDRAVDGLVDAALAAGGFDNITVILAAAVDEPAGPAAGGAGGAEAAGGAADQPDADDTVIRDPAPTEADADDTVVRDPAPSAAQGAPAGGTLLGAAAEREIPAAPRRSGPAPDAADDEPAAGAAATRAEAGTGEPDSDDESRYAPRAPRRGRLLRTLLLGLVILLVAAAGLGAGYAWTRTQYFVGASGEQVAIYQGLPDGLLGLPLAQVYEVQDLPVASLPPFYRAQVSTGIEVPTLGAARATVDQLEQAAARCAESSPSPRPETSTPEASTSASPRGSQGPTTASPSASASASTTATATAKPTASAASSPLPGLGC